MPSIAIVADNRGPSVVKNVKKLILNRISIDRSVFLQNCIL